MIIIRMDSSEENAFNNFILERQEEIEWLLADILACKSLSEIAQGSFMKKVGESEYYYFEDQLLITCTFNAQEFSFEVVQNYPTYH